MTKKNRENPVNWNENFLKSGWKELFLDRKKFALICPGKIIAAIQVPCYVWRKILIFTTFIHLEIKNQTTETMKVNEKIEMKNSMLEKWERKFFKLFKVMTQNWKPDYSCLYFPIKKVEIVYPKSKIAEKKTSDRLHVSRTRCCERTQNINNSVSFVFLVTRHRGKC